MGGSQRLTRAVGKAKAMDMVLTGRTMDAEEAERSGLVSRLVPADDLLTEAKALATEISRMSLSAARRPGGACRRALARSLPSSTAR
ncbi:MAG: echA8 [Mycobacterium sp.]|jgi:enoyl-CoA hydratase|nr:echA8 [Mycobacterium sp.]